jgi:L-ascorbate metabolism protein UlaG (beta-lactamase superfamily)
MKPFHPKKAGWLGYIIEIEGKRVYVSGDTDKTAEAESVKCDIAFVPIGGFYTMNVKEAAELINIIKPELAIPTHYGSAVGKPSFGKDFSKLVEDGIQVIEKIENY